MKTRLLLLALLLLFTLSTSAQFKNERGTITLKDGQTLTGSVSNFIDDPNLVVLIKEDGSRQNISVVDVKEIKLYSGKQFVSAPVKTSKDTKDLLLQTILLSQNKVSLYKREDNKTVFYVSNGDSFYSLENNKVIREENGKTYTYYDNHYVSVLTQLMQDRIDLVLKLGKVKLDEKDLVKLMTEYANNDILYLNTTDIEKEKAPYWSVYTQYSGYSSFQTESTSGASYGYGVGFQYHYSKNGRSSFKLYLNDAFYTFKTETLRTQALSTFYQYDVYQAQKFTSYLSLQVLDVGYYKTNSQEFNDSNGFYVIPRFIPGLGFEYRPKANLGVYAELNQLLLGGYPKNHNIGLKYNF